MVCHTLFLYLPFLPFILPPFSKLPLKDSAERPCSQKQQRGVAHPHGFLVWPRDYTNVDQTFGTFSHILANNLFTHWLFFIIFYQSAGFCFLHLRIDKPFFVLRKAFCKNVFKPRLFEGPQNFILNVDMVINSQPSLHNFF